MNCDVSLMSRKITVQHYTDLTDSKATGYSKRKQNTPIVFHNALLCYDCLCFSDIKVRQILAGSFQKVGLGPVTQHHVYLSVCQHGGTASANTHGAPDTLSCNTRATLTPSKIWPQTPQAQKDSFRGNGSTTRGEVSSVASSVLLNFCCQLFGFHEYKL